MDGVEILNTIYEYGNLIHPMWVRLFSVAALFISILGMCTIPYDNIQNVLTILAGIALAGSVICGIGASIETDEVVDIKYQVTIAEEVDMIEFMDKYEILDQEGKIYTVREKE